jgi:hypothetical protein
MTLRMTTASLCVALGLAGFILLSFTRGASAQASDLTGYLWSDTIGWIDLSCSNTDACGTNDFRIAIASDGTLSGHAWSDNIGWVSAESADVSDCPSSPCTPKIANGVLQGWLRATAADGDGWDGWISLSGDGYGISLADGAFSGYAWGSAVVGWVDWSFAHSSYTPCVAQYNCAASVQRHQDANCADTVVQTCPYQCAAGACITPLPPAFNAADGLSGHLQVVPMLLPKGLSTTVYWNVANVESCTVTGSNGDSWTGASGQETSAPLLSQTIYTLHCTALPTASPPAVDETATVNLVPIFQEL